MSEVLYEVDDHVARLTLNRPERLNAITLDMLDLLTVTHDDSGASIDIVNSLEPDAYGLDLTGIKI